MDELYLKYLKSLSVQFPNIAKASTEMINLQARLNLPKETEHFVSDIHGEYEQFLQGKDGLDKSSEQGYWSQLVDNCHQFMHQQEQAHRGVHEVRIVNAKTDTLHQYTCVFVMLCFGDSTNEEIVVPMVERDGRWYMR